MGMDVSQIIEAFGGPDTALTLLGVSKPTLYLWQEEGIPPKRWKQISELADRLKIPGVTLDIIMQAQPSRTRTRRSERVA
jgi:hypothetical protein